MLATSSGNFSGTDGSRWRDGTGAPSDGLGADNDYYLDDANGYVYVRASGTYTHILTIKGTNGSNGSAGVNGTILRSGVGAPSDALGANGDYYIDVTTGNLYLRDSGTYSVAGNIKGPTGAAGTNGATWTDDTVDPDDGTGVDGDYALNTTSGDVFKRVSGVYTLVGNLIVGTPGADGSVWHTGSGAPSGGLGADGDYYLRSSNSDVYLKTSGSWSVVANIKGATGSTGATGPGYAATSTTSLVCAGSGSKSFTTQAGLAYTVGARIRATSTGSGDWMEGVVTSYSSTTLVATMDLNSGSGTRTDWNINLAGVNGTRGSGTTTSSATPTINTGSYLSYFYSITALAAAITSFTTNLSGTPGDGYTLWIAITDNGTARAITWGSSFESSTNATLPTTTVISTRMDIGFIWNSATSKWRCVAVA